jgi:hypothetical protein
VVYKKQKKNAVMFFTATKIVSDNTGPHTKLTATTGVPNIKSAKKSVA